MGYYGQTVPPRWVRFQDIGVGGDASCGLDEKGQIHCWGDLEVADETLFPKGTFVDLDCGDRNCCAIDDSALLSCWGTDNFRIPDVPDGEFVQVSVGAAWACAIDTSGYVTCWGYNYEGAINVP